MIPSLGHAALWLAAAFAGLQLVAGTGRSDLAAPAAYAHAALTAAALLALVAAFQTVDLSVEAVIAHADVRLPPLLRLAAVWAGRPGALLLAAALLGLAGALAALGGARPAVLARLGAAGMAIDAVLLLGLDPFARAVPAPTSGNGLAPALQLPGAIVVVPLAAAAAAALAVALALPASDRQRWRWAAAGLATASAFAALHAGWALNGTIGLDPMLWPGALIALAAVALGRIGRPALVLTLAGLVLAGGALAGSADRTDLTLIRGTAVAALGHHLRLVDVRPVAGATWTGLEATVGVDDREMRPQRRDYPLPPATLAVAAAPPWRGTSLALLGATPGRVRVRLERRPLLAALWLGGTCLIAAAFAGGLARPRW